MNREQEKIFKNYVRTIEDLVREREIAFDNKDLEEYKRTGTELQKTRIEFFEWFKKFNS